MGLVREKSGFNLLLNNFKISYLLILVYFIFLLLMPRLNHIFPSLPNVRLEDFLTPFLFIVAITLLFKNRLYEKKVVFAVLLYYLYMLTTTIVNFTFSDLHIYSFIIYGKIFQYFLVYIILIYVLSSEKYFQKIEKMFFVLFAINILYGMVAIVLGLNGYYGIGTVAEHAPFLSGSLYFHSLVFMVYMFFKYQKKIYTIFSLMAFVSVLATVARLNIIASLIFLSVLFLFTLRKRNLKYTFYGFLILLIAYFAILSHMPYVESLLIGISRKFGSIMQSLEFRYYLWTEHQFSHFKGIENVIFGMGIGEANMLVSPREWSSFGLAVDNHYIRLLMEIGIVGIFVWFFAVLAHIFYTKNKDMGRILTAYIVAMMAVGVGSEVFFVTKPGVLFLSFLALFYMSSVQTRIHKNTKYMD